MSGCYAANVLHTILCSVDVVVTANNGTASGGNGVAGVSLVLSLVILYLWPLTASHSKVQNDSSKGSSHCV